MWRWPSGASGVSGVSGASTLAPRCAGVAGWPLLRRGSGLGVVMGLGFVRGGGKRRSFGALRLLKMTPLSRGLIFGRGGRLGRRRVFGSGGGRGRVGRGRGRGGWRGAWIRTR